jgi:cytochrome c
MTAMVASLTFTGVSLAAHHTPEERGKAAFNNTRLGGGKAAKSCNSCHAGGKGLEHAAGKKEFNLMGKKLGSLEDAVNVCIEMALKGKAIDVKSDEMKDIVAYIKSLGGKSSAPAAAPAKAAEKPKKKKAAEGC